jgi:glutathione S-transferase
VSLRLHWSPDSANLIVRLALEELGLPFEAVRIDRARGDHKSPAYLALNPQGLIPVLQDGELVLFETGAILWHLAARAGRLGADGPPASDAPARAATLKWLFYLSNTPHAELRAMFYTPRYVDGPDAVAALRRGLAARLRQHLDLVEGQLADGGLVGAEVTLADLYLAMLLRWAQLYPKDEAPLRGLDAWPRVFALCRRVEDRPAAARAFAAEAIPPARAITAPRRPDLAGAQVTG